MVVELPEWLDTLIFKELKAMYCPQCKSMVNIDDDQKETQKYLGTYFPRSYAESYCIFNKYFQNHGAAFANKEELSILDFGSGTGGEIIGLITFLNEKLPDLKKINVVALDGNKHALRMYDKILCALQDRIGYQIKSRSSVVKIDDFYDLNVLNSVVSESYDIVISFKAVCEFVTKQQFEQNNPYKYIAEFLLQKLKDDGLLLLVDVTLKNDISQQWLPKMMDNGLQSIPCNVLCRNEGYNQKYFIKHSCSPNPADESKVAWRMLKRL